MNIFRTILVLSVLFVLSGCSSIQTPGSANIPQDDGWELVWSDDFSGDKIDSSKWEVMQYNRKQNPDGPDGWWLKEDAYLDGKGELVLRCRKIDNGNSDKDPFDYSTGAIRSKGKFEQKFGKFEIKCKLPAQTGWWVAFWLMSQSVGKVGNEGEDGTEIDIFEGFGKSTKINHALHWDGYGKEHKSKGNKVIVPGIDEGYHVYSLEWNEKEYIFFIDGKESWRSNAGGVSKVPAYVKVTAELSTEKWAIGDNWAGNPEKALYPDYFQVDYVKVYRKKQ
ncbi:MAG TPA: hypothetical protein DET40_01395 [Lentisphaeria bacterium]|nr:MAG: hypothetical protein A2X45_09355 [Lentisphaerae bacterium GWF2_50_93]HCE42187.1 hypothetical protein [Lentisphaeria bacterium]